MPELNFAPLLQKKDFIKLNRSQHSFNLTGVGYASGCLRNFGSVVIWMFLDGHMGKPGKNYQADGVTNTGGTYTASTSPALRGSQSQNIQYGGANAPVNGDYYDQGQYTGGNNIEIYGGQTGAQHHNTSGQHSGSQTYGNSYGGTGFQPHAYANIGVAMYETGGAAGIQGRLGYNFHEYFGVEGEAGLGVLDESETIGGTEFDTGVNYSLGAFGVARYPVTNNLNVLARAGYHYTEIGSEGGGASVDVSNDGFAAGGGLEYMWNENSGVRGEYTYMDGELGALDTFALSYVQKF